MNLSYIQAQAIQEEEKKAAMKYGNMKKKQSDVMRKRMMGVGDDKFSFNDFTKTKNESTVTKFSDNCLKNIISQGGKQYFDSGDYNVGKSRPTAQMLPQAINPEQPAPEKLRNRKASIPNKTFSRLQS